MGRNKWVRYVAVFAQILGFGSWAFIGGNFQKDGSCAKRQN